MSKLQRTLMEIADTKVADDLLAATSSMASQARLRGCRVKRSGLWLTVFPSSSILTLLDSHIALAVRLRIGLPPKMIYSSNANVATC